MGWRDVWSDTALQIVASTGGRPDLAVILGSGLGDALNCSETVASIPYSEIPGFPLPSVPGHAGRLHIGRLHGWTVWFFCGRLHLYEGHCASTVVAPVEFAAAAGASRLLLTNAAGSISADWSPGSFMWIEDHINFTGDNPLRGVKVDPFVDLSRVYRNDLYQPLLESLGAEGSDLHRGILAALTGPSYETPAEIRALHRLGADAVSMSTVPEAIMARYLRMDVVGLSFLSNFAAGVESATLNHAEVLTAARGGAARLSVLLKQLIPLWQKIELSA